MSLAKFTRANGTTIYINPAHVIAIYPSERADAITAISCTNDSVYAVREHLEFVAHKLNMCLPDTN